MGFVELGSLLGVGVELLGSAGQLVSLPELAGRLVLREDRRPGLRLRYRPAKGPARLFLRTLFLLAVWQGLE